MARESSLPSSVTIRHALRTPSILQILQSSHILKTSTGDGTLKQSITFPLFALLLLSAPAYAGHDDADLSRVRIPALQKGTQVLWKFGKGVVFTNGENKATLYGHILQRFDMISGDIAQNTNNFAVKEARIGVKASIAHETKLKLILDGANTTSVKDAWIEQRLWHNEDMSLAVRAGQQKPLFGREQTGSSTKREFTDASLASGTFSGQRSRGVNLILGAMDKRLHVFAGAFNSTIAKGTRLSGQGEDSSNTDVKLNFGFGATLDSDNKGGLSRMSYAAGDLKRSKDLRWSIGAGVWIGNEGTGVDSQSVSVNLSAVVKTHGIHGMVDAFYRTAEEDGGTADASAKGFTIQGSYVTESMWTFGARYSWVDIDDDAGVNPLISVKSHSSGGTSLTSNGSASEITIMGGKFFNGRKHKVLFDFTFQNVDPDSGSSVDNLLLKVSHLIVL
ncbi:MAG TPA: hypothetical protein ENK02_07105 [Planctomycetes bacterium]|nr:hypothetical protein [Planctomycetota bacterium]